MNKEIIIHTYTEDGVPGVFSLLLLTAFSRKQRESIRDERDQGKCHFPGLHSCNGDKLEVHHLIPQRYAQWLNIEPDYAENGLTVCSNAHDLIHPDRVKAKKSYWRDRLNGDDSYKTMGQQRDEKLRNHEIYWVDIWDERMLAVILKLTLEAVSRGWIFPEKRGK